MSNHIDAGTSDALLSTGSQSRPYAGPSTGFKVSDATTIQDKTRLTLAVATLARRSRAIGLYYIPTMFGSVRGDSIPATPHP